MEGEKPAGIAVIAAEESELTVILLKGAVSLSSLGSLGALMGVPNMQLKSETSGAAAK
jgi:hypothetical protein